jgi:signal transduction histidine kinase
MLLLGYAIFGVGLWLAVRYAVSSAVDDLLIDRLGRLVDAVASDADGPEEVEEELVEYVAALPESHLAQVRDSTGETVFPIDEAPWEAGEVPSGFQTVPWEEVPYRVLTQDITVLGRSFQVRLASSLQSLVLVRERLAAALLLAAPLALVLCSGGGLYIARRALKPLDRIAETAAGVTVGNLSSRIKVPPTRDSLERLARTFNQMLERLESSVNRIEQFSADASHELRTPLTVIRTTSELALRHGRTEEEYRADLRDIHAQAVRLSELIEVLLSLSREGAERRPVVMSEIDLFDLASDVCRQFQKEAESKGLRLEIEGPGRPVVVMGNDPSLRRMIASLLENAFAHSSAGGITVSVRNEGTPEVSVSDTGEGIPEEALGRVFDRFYRVDSSRSRATGGHGLGLSIALRIATLHDAELTAESRLGEGSRFTVRFRRKGGDE